jgi:hypothetical protein
MIKPKEANFRPSLSISNMKLIEALIEQYMNSQFLAPEPKFIASSALVKIKKELLKAEVGLGAAYIPVPEDSRVRSKPLTVEAFGFEPEINGILTDKQKTALMSEEERKLELERVQAELMAEFSNSSK